MPFNVRFYTFLFLIFLAPSVGFSADRMGDEFKPVGIHAGNLMLYPSVQVMENFNSNIYGTKNNEKSDLVTVLNPTINVQTLDTEKGANFYASSHHGFFKQHDGENYNDYALDLQPYVTITRALKMTARVAWEQSHDQRTDDAGIGTESSVEPAKWQRSIGRLGWEYKRARVGVAMHGEYATYRHDNVARMGGGADFINDDRDRDETELGGQLSCDLTDRTTIYWDAKWFGRHYRRLGYDDLAATYTGNNRDSDGILSVIGIRVPLTNLISADINAGYRTQNFDTTFNDIGTGVGSASLNWEVTPITTLKLTGTRQVFETNQDGAAALAQTAVTLDVTHELRRNIILGAQLGTGRNAYYGINRNDDFTSAGAGVTYKLNRHLILETKYMFDVRDSTDSSVDYARQRVFVTAKVPF